MVVEGPGKSVGENIYIYKLSTKSKEICVAFGQAVVTAHYPNGLTIRCLPFERCSS